MRLLDRVWGKNKEKIIRRPRVPRKVQDDERNYFTSIEGGEYQRASGYLSMTLRNSWMTTKEHGVGKDIASSQNDHPL